MDVVKDILKRYDLFYESLNQRRPKLRFGKVVGISTIASQFYCEKAVELDILHQTPPTKIMQRGTAGHEAVSAAAKPVSHEEAIQSAVELKEKPSCLYEFKIAWIYKDVPIVGLVDEAWFNGGNLVYLLERKFSNNLNIYSSYHIQAQLYCLGISEMGFATEKANYRINVFNRSCADCMELKFNSCPIFTPNISNHKCDKGSCVAFVYPFDKNIVLDDLDWATGYWLGKREAIPTSIAAKCKVCRHKTICEHSII
jgi:hypothetical protein